jgi:bacteriorhodopsin
MWGRWVEILLGTWLAASPLTFGHADGSWFHFNDMLSGGAVILLAAASFVSSMRWAHLGIGAVALWVGLSAYFGFERPGPPAAQNEITTAFLLLTVFLVPNEASQPPQPWRRASRSNANDSE